MFNQKSIPFFIDLTVIGGKWPKDKNTRPKENEVLDKYDEENSKFDVIKRGGGTGSRIDEDFVYPQILVVLDYETAR